MWEHLHSNIYESHVCAWWGETSEFDFTCDCVIGLFAIQSLCPSGVSVFFMWVYVSFSDSIHIFIYILSLASGIDNLKWFAFKWGNILITIHGLRATIVLDSLDWLYIPFEFFHFSPIFVLFPIFLRFLLLFLCFYVIIWVLNYSFIFFGWICFFRHKIAQFRTRCVFIYSSGFQIKLFSMHLNAPNVYFI